MIVVNCSVKSTSHLAEPNEDAAHGLEIERLVTVEDQHEATQLVAQRLHRLRLASSSRS